MNISSNLLTAVASGLIVVVGALTNGFWVFKTARQKNTNDFSIATADSIRKDNERLAKRMDETADEVTELSGKLAATRAERDAIEGERNKFRAACEIFRVLYDELVAGRAPSPDKLAAVKARLIEVGFLSSP